MFGQVVNSVNPNNQSNSHAGGSFNLPGLSKYLTGQNDQNPPADQPVNDTYEKTSQENSPTQNPTTPDAIELNPAQRNATLKKIQHPSVKGIALALGAVAVCGAGFLVTKHFDNKSIKTGIELIKYSEEVIKNSKKPVVKEFVLQLEDEPEKENALKAFIKIAKKWSNANFDNGRPVFHLVLKENARNCEGKIINQLNRTGDISGFANNIEKIELSTEPASLMDIFFNKKHPIKMNVGSYSYFNTRNGDFSFFKAIFSKGS